eukprot:TRINITY_DN25015_c0_g1_i1.p1 TRINITY_DN25015_c0_g1~~TRINITY_DN25015_c0_g1_i1.p1  ORF type:complete len:485 (-),score=105.38 TRINITY_DN25015_c0_g1_i1:24-1478(-)
MWLLVLLLSGCSFISLGLGCQFFIQSGTTLGGPSLRSSSAILSAQSCFDACCENPLCGATTWVEGSGVCSLKESRIVSTQTAIAEIGTQLWLKTTYTCSSTMSKDSTVFGDNMEGSGVVYARGQDCYYSCCQRMGCKAAAWVSSWGGCYLKSDSTFAQQTVTVEKGTELWIVGSRDTVSSVPPPPSACKRGVAYGDWKNGTDFKSLMSHLSWYYNWATRPDPISSTANSQYFQNAVEYVPMIWGEGSLASIEEIPEGTQYLLGFNEPNFVSQANLTPERAAYLWPQLQSFAARRGGIKLISPAVNYCGGACIEADPIVWLDKFFANCTGCQVDYIAVHLYVCQVQYLAQHLQAFKKYGKPIWLTEFSCGDEGPQPAQVQTDFIAEAIQYLDAESDVFRYAWFSGRSVQIPSTDLLAGLGELNGLGVQYTTQAQCGAIGFQAVEGTTTISPAALATAIVVPLLVIALLVVAIFIKKLFQSQNEAF